MKKQLLKFGPWLVLLAVGTIATPRYANTAPAPEPHPQIRAAANELREAREELRTAAHDFCGHRAEALEKTNEALRQLQLALACDRH
jgi:hypothetical protein